MRHYKVLHPVKPIAVTELLEGERWSPEYFRPDYMENERILQQRSDIHTLGSLVKRLTCGPFGSSVPSSLFQNAGVPFVRMSNVRPFLLDTSNIVHLSDREADRLSAANFKPGDLVLSKTGKTGLATVLPDGSDRYVISQDVVGIELKQPASGYFITAFLNSRFGELQFRRIEKGNVQAHLDLTTTRELLVPLPNRRIQDYIGTKVELAERCRAKAMLSFREARERFDEVLSTENFEASANLTNIIAPNLLTQRLSSEFYLPRYFDLDEHLLSLSIKIKTIGSIVRFAIIRTTTPNREDGAAIPCILTSDIEPQEIHWREPSLRITPGTYDSHNGKLEEYDVVYASVGPPVGEAAVVLPEHLPIAVGGDVSVLRTTEEAHPGFLCLYLNSVFGQMQNDRYSRGIRQRRVYPEDIGSFLIPVPKSADQLFIGERIIRYEQLSEKAVELTNEARTDVEALIEGTLDTDAILSGKVKPPTWEMVTEKINKEE